ncbi:hypothetical protein [Actinophytocola sp.]|uniref:hypothetical protein n=1 Tax=Actinophytocola sp. TaxID=1872138 RepID=UPI002D59A227|nr:hypothetical protein [Actinophytocola sp.]HYQ69103.1 hypothetical protein [Actinophytocola sp.]
MTAEEFVELVREQGRQLSASGLTAIEREDNGPLPGTARAIAAALGRKVRDFHPDVTPEEVRP